MASGYRELTATQQRSVSLPDEFMCRDCKKFKAPKQFSNREINTFRFKKVTGLLVTGITAKLRCRGCTGDQNQELQCTGPCGLWRGLEEFSKNQRKISATAWCITCTQWKEANEPGVTPAPPPNAALAPDEEKLMTDSESGFPYTNDDIEGDADSDDDGGGFIYNSMSSMSIGAGANTYNMLGFQSNVSSIRDAASGYDPDTYPEPSNMSANGHTFSSKSNPYETRTIYTGGSKKPHEDGSMAIPSLSNENARLQSSTSGEGWSVADGKRRGPGVAFNAWDSFGQVHTRYKAPSTTTGMASSTAPSCTADPPVADQSGAWAKLTTRANPLPQFPPIRRPVKSNDYDEGEESQDEC